jgi:hypothetical protein
MARSGTALHQLWLSEMQSDVFSTCAAAMSETSEQSGDVGHA